MVRLVRAVSEEKAAGAHDAEVWYKGVGEGGRDGGWYRESCGWWVGLRDWEEKGRRERWVNWR